jgi:glycosyltransferase involved in cell wall biosynthesis
MESFEAKSDLQPNDPPLVSIIMPAYRVAKYIGAAVESVFSQTFQNYEIIVINDGSPDTDELEAVLAPYRDRIVYLAEENRGCSGARNTGIKVARGKYIALLDPDDLWEPDYLSVQVSMLEQNPDIDVVYPNALIFGDSDLSGKTFMDVMPSHGEVTFESLISQRCNVMISVTAKRDAIVRAGLFNEGLRSAEDFDMWLRILHQGGRIAYHRQELVKYRRHHSSLSADPVWMCRHILKVLVDAEKRNKLTTAEEAALKLQISHFHALVDLNEGKREFFAGNPALAIEKLKKANEFFRSTKLVLALMALRAAPQLLLRVYNIRDRIVLGTNTKF